MRTLLLSIPLLLSSTIAFADDNELMASFVICPIDAEAYQAEASVMPTAELDEDATLLNVIFYEYFTESAETAIQQVSSSDSDNIDAIYNLQGVKMESYVKGINIIRYKNGTTKNILIVK